MPSYVRAGIRKCARIRALSSCYEFDSHDLLCWFNEEKEKADKPRMLELLGKLNARIAELNDGSFVVDDQETSRVEAL